MHSILKFNQYGFHKVRIILELIAKKALLFSRNTGYKLCLQLSQWVCMTRSPKKMEVPKYFIV